MRSLLFLTWHYLKANKIKTGILFACLTITFFLPLVLHFLVGYYETDMLRRARATPLILGAKGDRYDLVLKTLYFSGDAPEPISMAELEALRDQHRGLVIPLHLAYSAHGYPVIGTSIEYFEFRQLSLTSGTLPVRLGDCVLGYAVAENLGIGPGGHVLTDQASLYNIGASYPLKMRVTGVLEKSDTPDDGVVFTDTKSDWIIAGIGHGHTDLSADNESIKAVILGKEGNTVTANAAIVEYTEITDANIDSFHFHADLDALPLTALIVVPDSDKSATLLKGRMSISPTAQLLIPTEVVSELMNVVFKVKRFFDSSFILVALATTLFLVLVLLLSLRLRRAERNTMFRIGCARGTIFWLHFLELGVILLAAGGAATLLSFLTLSHAPRLLQWLS
jgi:putative ABC transport system permease protein